MVIHARPRCLRFSKARNQSHREGKKGIRERGNLSIREMGIRARSLMSFSLLSLKAPKRAIPEFDKGEFVHDLSA